MNEIAIEPSSPAELPDEGVNRVISRRLHMVRVDGIEHFYWELAPALELLAVEPEADFEIITVH